MQMLKGASLKRYILFLLQRKVNDALPWFEHEQNSSSMSFSNAQVKDVSHRGSIVFREADARGRHQSQRTFLFSRKNVAA
jgi:hypothetical protein